MITSAGPMGILRALCRASRESGRPIRALLRDYRGLRRAGRRLLLAEYLAFGLWRRGADPEAFAGVVEGAILSLAINYRKNRRALVHDKLLFDAMLRGLGYPVPELQAVISALQFGGAVRSLKGPDEVALFLSEEARYPLFLKPAKGQNSRGAIALDAIDEGRLLLSSWRSEEVDTFARRLCDGRQGPILVQSRIARSAAVSRLVGGTVACIRVITFLEGDRPQVLRAFWKIPVGAAVADNLWRGNMIGTVDVETGRLGPVRAHAGLDAPVVTHHPDTGAALAGFDVSGWEDVLSTSRRAASRLRGMPLVGWDAAIGEDGPVIVEANSVPSVELTQYPEQRGFLIGDLLGRMEGELARLKTSEIRDARAKQARVAQLLGTRLLSGFGVEALRQR